LVNWIVGKAKLAHVESQVDFAQVES